MSKPRGNIAALPYALREQINQRLLDNVQLLAIAKWLIAEGFIKGSSAHSLEVSLSRYRRSDDYVAWLADRKRDGAVGKFAVNLQALAAAHHGGDALNEASAFSRTMLSLAADRLEKVMAGNATTEDVAMLFKAGQKLVGSVVSIQDARLEREKFETEIAEKLLDESLRARATAIAESNAPRSEKIAALRQAYFADIDALQKAGEVKLPQ